MALIKHPRSCLSAGHGVSSRVKGRIDPGADVVKTSKDEWQYALGLCKSVATDLRILYGTRGEVFVRDQGVFYLADDFAVDNACDLFLEIHLNSGGGTGTEALYRDSKDKTFAANLSGRVAGALGLRNRGAKYRDDLAVLKTHPRMVQCLLECWFADNARDLAAHNRHRDAEVLAIVNSVLAHNGWKQVKSRPSRWTWAQRKMYRPF